MRPLRRDYVGKDLAMDANKERALAKWKHWPWCAKQGWMPDHVVDDLLDEAGIDADKELQRAMDTVARYEVVSHE